MSQTYSWAPSRTRNAILSYPQAEKPSLVTCIEPVPLVEHAVTDVDDKAYAQRDVFLLNFRAPPYLITFAIADP
jgi:hypothetical protein